jgi:hypothetical protein
MFGNEYAVLVIFVCVCVYTHKFEQESLSCDSCQKCVINSLILIWGKIFRSRKCAIKISYIKLPLEESIPDDEKKFFEKFHVLWDI